MLHAERGEALSMLNRFLNHSLDGQLFFHRNKFLVRAAN